MKSNRLQCKDIPDRPVLEFLLMLKERGVRLPLHDGSEGTWISHSACPYEDFPNSVIHAMPQGTNMKLALAKMGSMIRRGLADGCACGCRGDFEITEKGEAVLAPRADEVLLCERMAILCFVECERCKIVRALRRTATP